MYIQERKSGGGGGGVAGMGDASSNVLTWGDNMSYTSPHVLTLKSVVFCSGKLIMFLSD